MNDKHTNLLARVMGAASPDRLAEANINPETVIYTALIVVSDKPNDSYQLFSEGSGDFTAGIEALGAMIASLVKSETAACDNPMDALVESVHLAGLFRQINKNIQTALMEGIEVSNTRFEQAAKATAASDQTTGVNEATELTADLNDLPAETLVEKPLGDNDAMIAADQN